MYVLTFEQMDCDKCRLSFTQTRSPMVLSCGHSFCIECVGLDKPVKCFTCHKTSKPVINCTLFKEVTKKNRQNVDKFVKVSLIGSIGVGKTSLVKKLDGEAYDKDQRNTIGVDFRFIDKEVNGKKVRFQVWDSTGQQRFYAITQSQLKGADILLLVYSCSMKAQQNNLGFWIDKIYNLIEHNRVIVVANKTDLQKNENCLEIEDRTTIAEKNWQILETSCRSGDNIGLLWQSIMKMSQIVKGKSQLEKQRSSIQPNYNSPKNKKECWC